MSILLNGEKICVECGHSIGSDDCMWAYCSITEMKVVAKAAAIHAVQYLEAPCTEHPILEYEPKYNAIGVGYYNDYPEHRYLCSWCMAEVHKELSLT
jgi:hypothetical protein